MIANVDKVIDWLKVNELKYWRVKVKDGDNATVFETTEGMSFDDNVNNLRKVMDISQGNRYTITASKGDKAQSKGNYFEEFRNLETSPTFNSNSQPVVSGISESEVDKRVQAGIEKFMTDMELKNLRERNAELEKELKAADTVTARIFQKIEPYIGTIIPSLVNKFIPGTQIGIAGHETAENETPESVQPEPVQQNSDNPDAIRLQAALETWMKADAECIDIIEIVARLASTGNPMYATAKGLLKNM